MKVPIVGAGMGRVSAREPSPADTWSRSSTAMPSRRRRSAARRLRSGATIVSAVIVVLAVQARQLERLGFLHIAIQEPLKLGFGSTIKLNS
jgi:hypothetical protein